MWIVHTPDYERMSEDALEGALRGSFSSYLEIVDEESRQGTWEHSQHLAERAPGVLLQHELLRTCNHFYSLPPSAMGDWDALRGSLAHVLYTALHHAMPLRLVRASSLFVFEAMETLSAYFNRGPLEWVLASLHIRSVQVAMEDLLSSSGGLHLMGTPSRARTAHCLSLAASWFAVMETSRDTPGVRLFYAPGVGV